MIKVIYLERVVHFLILDIDNYAVGNIFLVYILYYMNFYGQNQLVEIKFKI